MSCIGILSIFYTKPHTQGTVLYLKYLSVIVYKTGNMIYPDYLINV